MKKWKNTLKAVAGGSCAMLLLGGILFLGGCGQDRGGPKEAPTGNQEDMDAEDGGEALEIGEHQVYAETLVTLPDEVEQPYDIGEADGQVLLVSGQGLYGSGDQGDSWVKIDSFPASDCSAAAIGPSGEVAWCSGEGVVTLWKTDRFAAELHPDFPEGKNCYKMEFLSADKLLLMDTGSNLYVLDTAADKITGTIMADNGYHLLAGAVDEKILVWNLNGGVQIYDENGENPQPCEMAEQLFESVERDGLGADSIGVLAGDLDHGGFFFAGIQGLFHYTLGGSVTEQLLEGGQSAMGDNNYRIANLLPLVEGSFLVLYLDCKDLTYSLRRYTRRTAEELENQAELTLYTLYDNAMLRQELNVLMQQNPDYTIFVEVGVTGENGVTAEDAIKTLNTEIMAGKGPDLILLDGMAVEPYIEKGILADLSQVLEQVDEEEGIARNITDAFAVQDGIYAVPARFTMPLMAGAQTDIDGITDLESLADCVGRLKGENPELSSILGMYGRTYLETLFEICAPAWIKEGGVDQEGLKEFLETAKEMQDIQQEGIGDADIQTVVEHGDRYNIDSYDSELELTSCVENDWQKLALFSSKSLNFSMGMLVNGLAFDFAKGQSSHVFIPREIIAVNGAGDQAEQARGFVHDFLSSASQSQFVLEDKAYPVNKIAMKGEMENELNAGDRLESWLEGTDATEEEVRTGLEKLLEMMGELDTCAVNDDILRDIVLEHGMNYLNGQESLEQAVNTIVQGLELRMAE